MTGNEYRVEFYRLKVPLYRVGAEVGLHPTTLSLYLNERRPLPASLTEKLDEVLKAARKC